MDVGLGNKRRAKMHEEKAKRPRKECDYGDKCYRKNPVHFKEFTHTHLESILDHYIGDGPYPIPDKYRLNRILIGEQLDLIVEQQLYVPCKVEDDGAGSSSVKEDTDTIKTKDKSPGPSKTEDKQTSKNKHPSSDQQPQTSTDVGTSSQTPNKKQTSEKSETSTDKHQSSDKHHQTSGDVGASSQKRPANSFPTMILTLKNSKNEDKTQGNTSMDYKKDPSYRPIVKPTRRAQDYLTVVRPPGNMAAKHEASAPYYIFYTTITAAKETHGQPYSITFQEILDHSLGELKCSLQINFMVEIGWLLAQYYFAGYSEKKLTILYGEDSSDLKTISAKKPQVDAHHIKMPTPFGTHHTKMMLLCYEDGSLRVVISTANLYIDDWENRTQGLWFSPRCPELPPSAMPHDGDSPTQFKRSLLKYLNHYHLPSLSYYVERVKRCDFSHINVFLVASIPGSHFDAEWGMTRVASILRQHCLIPTEQNRSWPLVAQASSLGSFGKEPKLWLTGDFLYNFTKIKNQSQLLSSPPELKLIYPSLENVRQSHDDLLGGGCLPYAASAHSKQPWLNQFLYQWKAHTSCRNRAMPHIKSYLRTNADTSKCAYYLLTSGNVSKAAWGTVNKGNAATRIMSCEAGVLLIPRFVINEDFFPLTGRNKLQLAYDLPPTKYTADMSPWVSDYLM